jgi:hypothetical protein
MAKKLIKKHQDYIKKQSQSKDVFMEFKHDNETEEELHERVKSVLLEFKATSAPENAADKLASEYEFRKSILKRGLLGGKDRDYSYQNYSRFNQMGSAWLVSSFLDFKKWLQRSRGLR